MDPLVESALISAAATLVGVGGTVVVAFMGFRNTRVASQAALDAARVTNKETLDATREGQLADRYTRAIDQLGSSTVDVTIGGIYALERIALDSPRDHQTVMEVLAACIRENSDKPLDETTGPLPKPQPEPVTRPDIQAAMTVIARRETALDRRRINLRRVHLPHADLPRANLSGADLSSANLTGANLYAAKLTNPTTQVAPILTFGTDLSDANLRDANLRGADLREADLRGADMTGADLRNADLGGAWWSDGAPAPEGWKRNEHGRLHRR